MHPDFGHIPAGLGASAAIALVMAALVAFLGRKGADATGPRWGVALGVGLGYVVGHAILREWITPGRLHEARDALRAWYSDGGAFPLFPGDVVDWLPWLVAAATVLGILDGQDPAPGWAKWENWFLITGLALWLLLAPLFAGTWEPGQGARWILGLAAAFLVFWRVLDFKADRLGTSMPIVMAMMAAAAAVALDRSGSYVYGTLAGALAATLGAIWVVSWASPRMTLERAAVPPFAVAYAGLILCGSFYAELPRPSAVALMVAPLATLVDWIGPVSRFSRARGGVVRVALLLIPLGIAVYIAIARRPPEGPLGGF